MKLHAERAKSNFIITQKYIRKINEKEKEK